MWLKLHPLSLYSFKEYASRVPFSLCLPLCNSSSFMLLRTLFRGLSYRRHVPITIAGLPCRWVSPSRVAASLYALRYYFPPYTLIASICQRPHPFIVHTVSLALECRSLTVSVGNKYKFYNNMKNTSLF